MNDADLRDFIERLADREALDWNAAARRLKPAQVRGLQRIASIATAYRSVTAPALPSRRFQRLVLHERLGSGFGGEVWRAHDPLLERAVALKLRPASDADPLRDARLLDEARALARIDHPNVLRVLGADLADDRLGIWSEFVDGENLSERMARDGRIGAEEARSLGAALCAALAAVHRAGFVHGDIKPANVMRTRDGRYVLCDLGSAITLRTSGAVRLLASGSPLYLAPEVLDGATPTVASDIYALGATLFHLLAGHAPVEGETLDDLLAAHRAGRRRHLRDERPELPRNLVAAIEHAIDPNPLRRHASAGALEHALAQQPPRRRVAWAIAAIALFLLVAIGAFSLRLRPPAALIGDVRWLQDGNSAPLFDGAAVRLGDRLHLRMHCTSQCWAYVFTEDAGHATSRLFPLPQTRANPLAANTEVVLPGLVDGHERRWRVGPAHAAEERMLLIVAGAPVNSLEAAGTPLTADDGERYRSIDALVPAQDPATSNGLDGVAARTDDIGGPPVELHWLRLRRSDAPASAPAIAR